MNAPEDTACDRYFTPSTLTQMLQYRLEMAPLANGDGFLVFDKDCFLTIRTVFKEWLRTVGIPEGTSVEGTRQLLITLVDEPGQDKEE